MSRAPNFFYKDPTAEVAGGLVRAIFGDPQARAELEQQQAEMDMRRAQAAQARAHGDLYTSQAEGQRTANTAQAGLPGLARQWALSQQQPEPQTVLSPGFENFDQPFPDAPARPDPITSLADFVGAMGQMNGDKIDPRQIMGTMGAFGGDDEFARRGAVAQFGKTDKDFALTSDRADQIAADRYQADQKKAFGVANISAGARRYAADASAGASRYGADVRADASRYGADVGAAAKTGGGMSRGERNNNPGNIEYGPFAKRLGATGSDGRFAVFPTFEAGAKAQETLLAGSGYVGGGRNTIDAIISKYAPSSDGNSVDNYANYVSRVTGIPRNQVIGAGDVPAVAEAMRQFEMGGPAKGGKAAAAAKPPKPVSRASLDVIDKEIDKYYPDITLPLEMRNGLRRRAVEHFQQTGNPVQAVEATIAEARARSRKDAARRKADAPPAETSWWAWGDATPKAKRKVSGTTTTSGGSVPTFRDDASANAFVGDPRNKGKSFIGPDGKRRKVI
jgi:hypothetical protein